MKMALLTVGKKVVMWVDERVLMMEGTMELMKVGNLDDSKVEMMVVE